MWFYCEHIFLIASILSIVNYKTYSIFFYDQVRIWIIGHNNKVDYGDIDVHYIDVLNIDGPNILDSLTDANVVIWMYYHMQDIFYQFGISYSYRIIKKYRIYFQVDDWYYARNKKNARNKITYSFRRWKLEN